MPTSGKRSAADTPTDESAGKKAKPSVQPSGGGPSSSRGPTPAARSSTKTTDAMKDSEHAMGVDTPEPIIQRDKKKNSKHKATEPSTSGGAAKVTHRKLAPPRPFPTVPTSVSATGPRSAHVEGKNHICVTRKTPLGAYLRRCKDVVLKAGCVPVASSQYAMGLTSGFRHKTLHLHAMGAAIPHLVQLSLSLPEILPYSPEEIETEVMTGTVEVQDEVIPEDSDEDISIRSRGKSTLSIIMKITDGKDEGAHTGKGKKKPKSGTSDVRMGDVGKRQQRRGGQSGENGGENEGEAGEGDVPERVVFRAEDVEEE
ncbi:uncharacterized protein PHACADRAFT_257045 [Phanerochaete carnosa HHB-10118-sp]|uniref:Uncharacterized protein n=1 Tax=Phanerochaete carnosa (strain HHB-10118-sp) TaxID=650164 RepID=K5W9Y9_PHACS|nr:uncharacterized protein PHACADRAFT_257045 [Phanerochaete carnosa HHB-10118-sp]EKM56025.1 hypothetical protein PHACADRAFT_257045 [Phanerochaete carnosa HHB-10118-sp]